MVFGLSSSIEHLLAFFRRRTVERVLLVQDSVTKGDTRRSLNSENIRLICFLEWLWILSSIDRSSAMLQTVAVNTFASTDTYIAQY